MTKARQRRLCFWHKFRVDKSQLFPKGFVIRLKGPVAVEGAAFANCVPVKGTGPGLTVSEERVTQFSRSAPLSQPFNKFMLQPETPSWFGLSLPLARRSSKCDEADSCGPDSGSHFSAGGKYLEN
jgi:hypothetical protein